MKKLLFIFISVSILFSCKNDKMVYEKNLNHFKNLIEDINIYFIDSTLNNLEISKYYTEDFIFYSYPVGHKKGVKTAKVDYINNLNQMKKILFLFFSVSVFFSCNNDKKVYEKNLNTLKI